LQSLELSALNTAMADDDERTFEEAESGASYTYPKQWGDLRKDSLVMIKGKPCKVTEITPTKTGEHGHAKTHIVALDIFTGKKYEEINPTSQNIEVPFSRLTEYQLLSADECSGEVDLLMETGETKDDLNLPTFVVEGEPTDGDKKVAQEILDRQWKGLQIDVTVLSACGREKIVGVKQTAG
jgi:translation initiation factor 5A